MVAASGCAPPMPPRPAVRDPLAGEIAAIVPPAHLDEGFVGALNDALAADIDPRAGRHLAVHHQALAIEFVEMLPGRPVRHQVGVGDQHARRIGVGPEDADRLARLDEQRLVALQPAQRLDDAVERLPVARGAADAAIDHQLAGPLGDVGIEVVHQHAQRRLGQPALGGKLAAARRAHHAHVVETGRSGHCGAFLVISGAQGLSARALPSPLVGEGVVPKGRRMRGRRVSAFSPSRVPALRRVLPRDPSSDRLRRPPSPTRGGGKRRLASRISR